jgi:hypothetical protein
MTLQGQVKNGTIVFDPPVVLPEGAAVRIELVESTNDTAAKLDGNGQTLGEKLLTYAGKAKGLPADLARCHDHYIHGTPRE